MHLPSARDLCDLIWKEEGRESFLYSADVDRCRCAWSLVCFTFQWAYYTDTILPFGLRLVTAYCQYTISIFTRELNRKPFTAILMILEV